MKRTETGTVIFEASEYDALLHILSASANRYYDIGCRLSTELLDNAYDALYNAQQTDAVGELADLSKL